MEPEQEPSQGRGDETDEDGARSPWLPPDDRLWRHPSEVRAHPSPVPPVARPSRSVWAKHPLAWMFPISVLSGLCGAALCAGILYASGSVGPAKVLKVTEGTLPVSAASKDAALPDGSSITDAVEPWVVGLSVNGNQGLSNGSGVVVMDEGNISYVVTDSELFAEAGSGSQVSVTTFSGASKTGQLVAIDPADGIAIVKVPWAPASTAEFGTVAELQTGAPVFAVGSSSMAAMSEGSSFASGPIIDQDLYIPPANGGSTGMFSMLVANFSLDPSAYGGALVDADGLLIGITNPVSLQLQKSGLTYITPIDMAMADVIEVARYGTVSAHAWLGVVQATDISGPGATQMGIPASVEVDAVAPGSPLARAGFQDGDIITAVGGSSVASVGELIAWLADAKPGQVVDINWLQDGHRKSASITLGDEPTSVSSG